MVFYSITAMRKQTFSKGESSKKLLISSKLLCLICHLKKNCCVGQNLQFRVSCPLSHTGEVNPYFTSEYRMEKEKRERKWKIGNFLPVDEEQQEGGGGRSCGRAERSKRMGRNRHHLKKTISKNLLQLSVSTMPVRLT